jgi:methenyltetrahydromethanopterin cyclohydrolase
MLLARVALGGQGVVGLSDTAGGTPLEEVWPKCPWPVVTVASADPVAACLASQYAGWKVDDSGYFAMASGPLRAAIGREEIFDTIGRRERVPVAVGLLEASQLPPERVCCQLADRAGVEPGGLILLVAATASPAGTMQVVARSLETALHQLHERKFDLSRIIAGWAAAPLPPVAADNLTAIGRTNDAILYGGFVQLEITGDDASLDLIGPQIVSSHSPAHGQPFRDLFKQANGDFYALDPAIFAPAMVEFINHDTGRRRRFGRIEAGVIEQSFTATG